MSKIFQGERSSRNAGTVAGALAALLILLLPALATAETYGFPASRLVIDLPKGFSPGALFSSIDNGETEQVFSVSEYPAASFARFKAEMTPERFVASGASSATAGNLPVERPYVFLRAVQPTGEEDFIHFFLATDFGDHAALVVSMVPQRRLDKGSVKEADILAALASVRPAADFKDRFSLRDLGPFREEQFFGTRRLYMLAGAKDGDLQEVAPAVLELAEVPPLPASGDLAKDAQAAMTVATGLVPKSVSDVAAKTIGGLDGIEVTGTATLQGGGDEMLVYQVYLRGKSASYRLLFRAPLSQGQKLLPQVKAVADGWVVTE